METKKLHISKTWLGQHYKAWRQSPDAKKFAGNELNCYVAYNDIGEDILEQLREWEASGFKEEDDAEG